MDLSSARQVLAEALSTVTGYNVRPRPFSAAQKAGDGWVTVGPIRPEDFRRCSAVLVAVIVLGADEVAAEIRLESDAVLLIDAVTGSELATADVALEPIQLLVGQNSTPVYGATITMTTEVEP